MKKIDGYDDIKVNRYPERIKLGGHICKILEVKIDSFTSKKDGKTYEFMKIKYDIDKPDEQAGFYSNKFKEDAKENALEAKWKGYHRVSVPTNESEDFIKSNFKAFITSVEKSNPGYNWNWEENTLVGKKFGGVFGFEEFTGSDGRTLTSTKIRYVRSIEKIEEVEIPKVKLLDKTLMDYDEYIEMKQEERKQREQKDNDFNNFESSGTSSIADDDLPF